MSEHNNAITQIRATIIENVAVLSLSADLAALDHQWLLLGTSGCHLCDLADDILTCFQMVQPIIYHKIDISEFDEDLMLLFAPKIPVLLTPTKRLDYPFSVLDLQRLLLF